MSLKRLWIFFVAMAWAYLSQAADAPVSAPSLSPAEGYRVFAAQMVSPENLAEFVAKSDALIDQGEDTQAGSGRNVVRTDTKNGFHLEFSVLTTSEAIMYYAVISRGGELLKYPEATTMLSLFCDRIGLTHPIHITEGERPIFYAQWLIKPKEWKSLRKKMLEVRKANRAEKDLIKALNVAVDREMTARASHPSAR